MNRDADNTGRDRSHEADEGRCSQHQAPSVEPVMRKLADKQRTEADDTENCEKLSSCLHRRRDADGAGGNHPRRDEPVDESEETRDDCRSVERGRITDELAFCRCTRDGKRTFKPTCQDEERSTTRVDMSRHFAFTSSTAGIVACRISRERRTSK